MSTIEKVREYWDRRPCNIRHSQAPLGTREYFDQVEKRKYMVEPHIPGFADFQKWQGKRVLEIGCGVGTDSVNFARAGASLTIVELSEVSLNLTKQRFKEFGLKANFICGDAEALTQILPADCEPFDLVYSFGVIHHTPDPKKVFREIGKVMKKGGELRVMLYAKYSVKSAMIWAGLAQPEAQTGCPIAFTYSAAEIPELIGPDFSVVSVSKDHIFPYRIADYIQYKYIKAFPWNLMPALVFRWIEKQAGWHLLIRAVKNPLVS